VLRAVVGRKDVYSLGMRVVAQVTIRVLGTSKLRVVVGHCQEKVKPNNNNNHHHSDECKNGAFEPSLTVFKVEAHLQHIAEEFWMT